jgi:hypothetical protein
LNGTLEDVRIIGADDLSKMKTWVDASYAVHMDTKSHTGGVVSFGTGAVMGKSCKQKLNTKSSMEEELVGASKNYLTRYGQGSFCKSRFKLSDKTHFTRTIRVRYDLRKMGGSRVGRILGTSTYGIISSKTGLRLNGSMLSDVPGNKCWRISS